MYIKKIELENFKSFKDKHSLSIGDRNIIVGKNGSGKSNLLNALHALFLLSSEKFPQYNNSDEPAVVLVEIDNSQKRFMLPQTFQIKLVHKDNSQFFINDKPVTKEELKGLLENAGFSEECFILQGKINDIATMTGDQRYSLLSKVAGLNKYEESKRLALKCLQEDGEDKVSALIEKIEMKMRITDEYKKKLEEFDNLTRYKAEAEYELLNHELLELNSEIDKLVVEEQNKNGEFNEGLIEYEIKACRDEIANLKMNIAEADEFINSFDLQIVDQIKQKLASSVKPEANENVSNFFSEGIKPLDELLDINPYNKKVEILAKAKDELSFKLQKVINDERDTFVQLKALKYFDAMGSQKEDIRLLEEQLRIKRSEIQNYDQQRLKSDYKNLVTDRKNLWVREKELKDEIELLASRKKELESKVLHLGKLSINVFESLKQNNGVIGSVYDLIDIPDEFIEAFESVAKSSLFWIVVENEDVATDLIKHIDERATFVALNRIKPNKPTKIKEQNVLKLSEIAICEERFKQLVELVCKDFYVVENSENALDLVNKYNVNAVTKEGDVFNKNGSITGGYESSNHTLRELKQVKKKHVHLQDLLLKVQSEIASLSEKIKYSEIVADDETRTVDSLKGLEQYLVMKIEFLNNKKISIPESCEIEAKHSYLANQIPQIKIDMEQVEHQHQKACDKKTRIDNLIDSIKSISMNRDLIEKLVQKEKSLIDSLYVKQANENIENIGKIQKKHMLIDKRSEIMKKLGITDFRSGFIKNSKESLINTLKQINKSLKNYSGFTKNEIRDDQRKELKERLQELKESKIKILDFINALDQKKESTFNLSFSMISENFSYFYERFTGKQAKLVLKQESIEIFLEGKNCDIFLMSGGQKTVIALSLLFAIQKNDKSPFYFFDEIDANLDKEHCIRLSSIIKELDAQYLITTFKSEMIESGNKFFGVVNVDKKSVVSEISKDVAYQSVTAEISFE